eukprot:6126796-Lingulodinium_polyedra.AAC.1
MRDADEAKLETVYKVLLHDGDSLEDERRFPRGVSQLGGSGSKAVPYYVQRQCVAMAFRMGDLELEK